MFVLSCGRSSRFGLGEGGRLEYGEGGPRLARGDAGNPQAGDGGVSDDIIIS
jgi:hypothetical protein